MKRKTKETIKKVTLGVLVLGLLAGAVALVSNLIKPKEDDGLKEIHPTFEYGGLDESGNYVDTKESLITKKAIEYNELKVSIDFDSNITYKLFYYDEDDKFVSSSEVLSKGHNEESEDVKYVRVLITPVLDEDVEDKEIKWYDVVKYTSQLKIETKVNEKLTTTLKIDDSSFDIVYYDGMTWKKVITMNTSVLRDSGTYVNAKNESGEYVSIYLNGEPVKSSDLFDPTLNYSFTE